jgi:predicted esterase
MADDLTVRQLTIETTAYYCVQSPAAAFSTPPKLLIALHGFGQKCKGFMRNFASLRDRNIMVAAPQGTHQFYMQLEPKKVGFNWLTIYEKENSIDDFVKYMARLLDALESEHGRLRDNVFLLGFSQGVSMAYRFAASGCITPRGLIACCADLPADVAEKLSGMRPFPVLISHAVDDPIFPLSKADDAEAQLKAHAFPVDQLRYEGGHTLPEEVVCSIGDWIEAH